MGNKNSPEKKECYTQTYTHIITWARIKICYKGRTRISSGK
jgi:hypothetical protein